MPMNRLLSAVALAAALLAGSAAAAPSQDPMKMPAGTYVLEKTHASVLAKVRHLGLAAYTMRFNSFDASYVWDPKAPEAAKVTVTIDVNSVDTGDAKVNAKFADEFLDGKNHPQATFVSTGIKQDENGFTGAMTGDLTLRGVTRPITLDVIFRGYEAGMLGARSGFSAVGGIKRSDFGSTNLSSFVADEIDLVIEVEFLRK
jgi:polyisoprenoid-binding protein YceI